MYEIMIFTKMRSERNDRQSCAYELSYEFAGTGGAYVSSGRCGKTKCVQKFVSLLRST